MLPQAAPAEPRAAGSSPEIGHKTKEGLWGGPEDVTVSAEATEHFLVADDVLPG